METMKTILSRKSVRSYKDTAVSEKALEAVLKAANASPVGMAKYETVHMTVIQNQELLHEIDRAGAEFFGDLTKTPLYQAPVLIVVSTKRSGVAAQDNVPCANVAMIVHNMCLAATDLGLGSCAIYGATAALSQNEELVKKLNLPEGFVPTGSVVIGETEEVLKEREVPMNRISTNYIK